MSLRLVSLNIDGPDNFDRVLPFLAKEQPDAACLQEICEVDLGRLQNLFADYLYVPMTRYNKGGKQLSVGFAVFHRTDVRLSSTDLKYYVGQEGPLFDLDERSMELRRATEKRVLALCTAEKDGVQYQIGTTHFTWVQDGKPNEYQRSDMRKLLHMIRESGELVLCGDFNAPRGGEIFGMLAQNLTDNVPPECTTSIDPDLHRVRGLLMMVDGVFSTPTYEVSDVKFTFGLSDHAALSCTVTRIK